jgi:hypothetical protein
MPDCWLEVSLGQEGPATGQLYQDFYVIFLNPTGNADLLSSVHAVLHASHAAFRMLIFNLIPIIRNIATVQIVSSAHNEAHILTIFFTSQRFTLPQTLSLPEGRNGTAWEPSKQENCCPLSL